MTSQKTDWMTVAEAAQTAFPQPYHTRHVRKLVAAGAIPPGVVTRIGQRVFFHRERLAEWLDAGGSLASSAAQAVAAGDGI